MPKERHVAGSLVAAALLVPLALFLRWRAGLSPALEPSPRHPSAAATFIQRLPSTAEDNKPRTLPPSKSTPPAPPVRESAPATVEVLVAMRDPMISPMDIIRMTPAPAPEPVSPPVEPPAPPPPPPPPGAGIVLEGIIGVGDGPKRAIVNGVVLGEGGKIGAAVVVHIGADRVTFKKGRKVFVKTIGD